MSDILIVDDERDIRELIGDILEDEGYTTRLAGNSNEAMAEINSEPPSLLILDIWLKDSKMDGIDILKSVKRDNPDVPVVIISGHGNIEIAVAAIKQGAYDFIEKPFNIDQLLVVIRRAMETSRLRRENQKLKRKETTTAEMMGDSASFRVLLGQLDKVTKSNGRVMLSGPAGAGKELAARYIHAHSARANAPFVTVNCAGVAPESMEETLFGRESADRGVEPGLLEQAHGGVIYFDEVADMPLGTQSKILRVLVDQQFTRVGGADKVRVDLRVISSTNRDLGMEIEAGRFRQELYHRLNVVPISVPSLEDRREDIPLLADYFIEQCHKTQGLAQRELSEDAVALLQTMVWPGNVRQLKNLVERVLILGDGTGL
ncbi:nitrogen assimilation response regulator NtrX, partial [Puniceibacterium confluentis]|uniref:nitrogen assimilation response regulator NtrX n=1 Tax=Puniceibacterium confluentis TaxID=1958944 RepID=UPI003561A0FA